MSAAAISVGFPLRGEWAAIQTPAHQVPSHGTDYLAQTYGYDFTRFAWSKGQPEKFATRGNIAYLLGRTRLEDCFAWSQPIHSPFEGTVVAAEDGWPERKTVHLLSDLFVVLRNEYFFDEKKTADLRPVTGNFVIIEGRDCFALIAHARTGSIRVAKGERVDIGQKLCEVGHSGNSTAPHLHFHLMDSFDPRVAKGIPCCFEQYEAFRDGEWRQVTDGMPGRFEPIRFVP